MEPLPLYHGHDSRVLRSWAKRTGHINTYVSGESVVNDTESVSNSITERSSVSSAMKYEFQEEERRLKLSNQDEIRSTSNTSGFSRKQQGSLAPLSSTSASSQSDSRSNSTVISTILPPPPPLPPSRSSTPASIVLPPPPLPPHHLRPASVAANPLHHGHSLSPPDPSSRILHPESIAEEESSADSRAAIGPYHHLNGSQRYHSKADISDSEIELPSHSNAQDHELLDDPKLGLAGNPGYVASTLYGLQHYLSMVGSIILIPLIIVPAMGGSDEDTATVVSTVLMMTGVATLMNSFFGSRLPLAQGPSFVYLAPALAIINAAEFQRIGADRFRHTMRELQGAVIVVSALQMLLGYSGIMSYLLRLVSPVVVTSTVAAVGLAFFTYGFSVIGSCVEIGIPQILVVLLFSLYLRRKVVFGHRIFQVYAIPLGLAIVWAYAYVLTEAGVYTYNSCNIHVPVSNIISDACREHVYKMIHCRTDVSTALQAMPWFRFPYPFQWGLPTFQWKTISVMMVGSVISSIDSIGSYHASSLLVATKAPTPGIVSRAIGMEGLNSILAGLWGIGTGVTTLTENVHTIAITKIANCKAIRCGACVLIIVSVFGKISAFIATIPPVIVAALLSVTWIMVTALGLSNMRYSDTGRSRNVIIVGASLFLSLSVPVYFQQYAGGQMPTTTPHFFQPYTVAAHGPIRTGFEGLDFFLNTTLSMNMAIAFLVAFFLDNTVEGNKEERGTYPWSKRSTLLSDIAAVKVYSLPHSLGKLFSWAKCIGL